MENKTKSKTKVLNKPAKETTTQPDSTSVRSVKTKSLPLERRTPGATAVDEQDLRLFQDADLDGNGMITREEFLTAFVRAGLKLTDRRFSESLQELEFLCPRSDSEIDFPSFQKIIRPNHKDISSQTIT